ncbi:MAG: hypothetical protein V4864_17945 [Pseudomonadota bacterium]
MTIIDDILARALSPSQVRFEGRLTLPRSWGVYELPGSAALTNRFRMGNHPIRMHELEREYGACRMRYLFASAEDAKAVAAHLARGDSA